MTWTNISKNIATFANQAKRLLYYFWGTDDDKYVTDHLGRKIIFQNNDWDLGSKNTATWSNISKS